METRHWDPSFLILAADFGTSALKIAVLDQEFEVLHQDKQDYAYIILPGEKVEEDPQLLLDTFRDVCQKIPQELRERIGLLSYDTYSPSLMMMDKEGKALHNVVTHLDRRSRRQSERICEVMGADKFQSITGVLPFAGGVSLTSLLWFMDNEPELCQRIHKIGHFATYLHKQFTGHFAIDLVNASMMGLYDTVTQEGWSQEILDTFDIPSSWLCPIYTPGEILGTLLPSMAAFLGVPTGIPVTVGTNDVVAAHAGAGNDRAGQVLNTAGSSDMISVLVDKPICHPFYYLRNASEKGLWQIFATTAGGFAVDWFRREFCREMSAEDFFERYLPQCVDSVQETELAFKPYLSEDRQSLERRTASWEGLTLASTREQMFQSLLCSMQAVLKNTLDLAGEQVATETDIKLSGGFGSPPIIALKKRIFEGCEFHPVRNCTLLGCAYMGMKYYGAWYEKETCENPAV